MRLLVTMSLPRKDITRSGGGREGEIFERARIDIVDWEAKRSVRQVEYSPPPEHIGEGCSVRFTGGCAHAGRWYQCTSTEVVVYRVPEWTVEHVISHPSFHDLHGVALEGDELAIANTGLEMVQFCDLDGRILREVPQATPPTWQRFDRRTDYRRVVTTKPHQVHPNHVFRLDGRWWVTRCLAKDAVCVDDPDDRIDVAVGNPHDGLVRGDFVYFTTTNARIVVVHAATRKVEEVIDLNELNPRGGKIGWCRGLEVEGDTAYVGFTRLRFSRWADTFRSAKDLVQGRKRVSHVERIDLGRRALVDSYDFERDASGAVFSVASAAFLDVPQREQAPEATRARKVSVSSEQRRQE